MQQKLTLIYLAATLLVLIGGTNTNAQSTPAADAPVQPVQPAPVEPLATLPDHSQHDHSQHNHDHEHASSQIHQANSADSVATIDAGKIKSQINEAVSSLKEMAQLKSSERRLIDLSYPLNDGTLHWPENSGFKYSAQVDGERKNQNDQTYYVKSDSINTALHTGTHMDAPVHFAKNGWTIDQVPLDRLIDVPVHVVDLSEKVRANRTYNFVVDDFVDKKTNESLVAPRSVVLVYTGISELYSKGAKEYFGTEDTNVANMKIPGFSHEAAHYLVERGIYGVGLDAASADSSDRHGPDGKKDLVAHIEFNANNIYILENVNNRIKELLEEPAGSVRLVIAPLPIVGGSGSPVRLIAMTAQEGCPLSVHNAGSRLESTYLFTVFAAMISFVVFVKSTSHL